MKHLTKDEKKWAKKKAKKLVDTNFKAMGGEKVLRKNDRFANAHHELIISNSIKCALITAETMIEETRSVVWYEVKHQLEKLKK